MEHPEFPWHQRIAQRNMLAHEYGDIRHEMIWRVVSERIPELLTILERLVPPPPPPEG
ncbi:MAG: HepT-like ribonuclease domain-containing protein [Candidatus Eisenbacteria bacterium]